MGNSKSKRKEFFAAKRGDKHGSQGHIEGYSSKDFSSSPRVNVDELPAFTGDGDVNDDTNASLRYADVGNALENSLHGQSKIQRIVSHEDFSTLRHSASTSVLKDVYVSENSVHREDWSYHGKANYSIHAPSNSPFAQQLELSRGASVRSKRARELLVHPLIIDESLLDGKPASTEGSRDCCSRFGVGREALHEAMDAALTHICEEFEWSHGQFWVAEESMAMLRCCTCVSYIRPSEAVKLKPFYMSAKNQLTESTSFLAGKPFENGGQKLWVSNLSMITQGVLSTAPLARFSGLVMCCCIPVLAMESDQILGYVMLYDSKKRPTEDLDMIDSIKAILSMTAELLINFVLFSKDKINRDDYRDAIRAFVNKTSAKTNEVAVPETIQEDVDVDVPDATPPAERDNMDVDEDDKNPATTVNSGHIKENTHAHRFITLQSKVLFHLGIVEQHLSWAHSMDSVDHKMTIEVLCWLAKNIQYLSQAFTIDAIEEVVMLVKYLFEVSPLKESESPVRGKAKVALENLCTSGFLKIDELEPPFFGPKMSSPVPGNMLEFKARLSVMFATHPRSGQLLQLAEDKISAPSLKLIDFRVGDVFNTIGQRAGSKAPGGGGGGGIWGGGRGGRSQAQQPGESKIAADLCTKLLRESADQPLVSVANMKRLHAAFVLDHANANGMIRTGLAVGSHRFFESYRVFAPPEEIESLLATLETEMAAEGSEWHPLQQAFYVFGSIVWFIHPFLDGNGRTARLFGNMILKRHGYPAIIKHTDKVITFEDFVDMMISKLEMMIKF